MQTDLGVTREQTYAHDVVIREQCKILKIVLPKKLAYLMQNWIFKKTAKNVKFSYHYLGF
jgi:hypothetical protein